MNAKFVHDRLIERAKGRKKPSGYCERHHIVPKSMGGTNSAANLVWLTGREHYIVHWLLFRIHRCPAMAFAWYRMTFGRKDVGRYTSHTFVYAKIAKAKAVSQIATGRPLSEEHRAKLRAAKLGRTYQDMGRTASSPLLGRNITDQHKARVAAASKGRRMSDEAKGKLRASKLGDKNHRYGKPVSEETRRKLSESMSAYRAKVRELKAQKETA